LAHLHGLLVDLVLERENPTNIIVTKLLQKGKTQQSMIVTKLLQKGFLELLLKTCTLECIQMYYVSNSRVHN
jgi:hypothetical protein